MVEFPRKADGRWVFSVAFKRETVARITSGEKTLAELSRELGISPSVVRNWMRLVERGGTNAGAGPLLLSFLAVSGKDVTLQPHEQRFIPDVLSYLGSSASAMPLEVYSNGGVGVAAFHASARTFSSAAGGGTFGVATPGLTGAEGALSEAWILGLKQDGLARSNLAFGNVAPPGAFPGTPPTLTLSVDFFDGDSGVLRGSRSVSLVAASLDYRQLNAPFSSFGIRNGYVRVRAPAGNTWQFFATASSTTGPFRVRARGTGAISR